MRTTVSIAALSMAQGGAAGAQELQYSTHLPPSILVNSAGVIPVFEAVTEATGGAVVAKFFWAGQLYDAPGNLEAISDGVIDAAFTQRQATRQRCPRTCCSRTSTIWAATRS